MDASTLAWHARCLTVHLIMRICFAGEVRTIVLADVTKDRLAPDPLAFPGGNAVRDPEAAMASSWGPS